MYIKVRVKANARKEEIVKESDDHYVVSVKEEAKRNEANRRIIEIFKELYPGKEVRIIHGHQSPGKLLSIDD